MAEIKTKGIVLSSFDFEENSKIVTTYTEKYGKMSFVARGVNKPESKNRYSIQNFSYSEFEIFKSRFKTSLSKLKKGILINSNVTITNNYDNYLFASVITSLIDLPNEFNNKNYRLFTMLNKAIENISSNIDPFTTMVYFMFYLLKHLGGSWNLESCYRCKQRSKVYRRFDFKNYGLICPNCLREDEEEQNVDFLNFLRILGTESFASIWKYSFDTSFQIILAKLVMDYLLDNLGIETNSIRILKAKKIFNDDVFNDYTHSVLTKRDFWG
ncbi:DNA repair protein RecO [[Acholeplasma] multilocale]|uniref:DNA repair protein RecO n=1 Tax=[Acholeplasma] multilocale TaxID=264638 RepID=UPI0006882A15|nr:DNA repair protein RecO [[Acholeplasma] multilocale]